MKILHVHVTLCVCVCVGLNSKSMLNKDELTYSVCMCSVKAYTILNLADLRTVRTDPLFQEGVPDVWR